MANIKSQSSPMFFRLSLIATILALCVVMLGAYTRLKDAGLGCPDWPGCYGQITVPHTQAEVLKAVKLYPVEPVVAKKAWPEMIHRYFAGTLGLLIFGLAIWAVIRRMKNRAQILAVPVILALLVIFQAALGMWTVTWKLLPLVVMGHLLGGMTIAALLWWMTLRSGHLFYEGAIKNVPALMKFAVIGLIIVALQIFLGGWTSANYASLACPDFPFCHGSLFPAMELKKAFSFLSPIGTNYQGGVLDMTARETIQMFHRYGAFIVASYVGILSLFLILSKNTPALRSIGWIILSLLAIQFTLGVLNVELLLPLKIAVAHNGVAALLLLSMVTLVHKLNNKAPLRSMR